MAHHPRILYSNLAFPLYLTLSEAALRSPLISKLERINCHHLKWQIGTLSSIRVFYWIFFESYLYHTPNCIVSLSQTPADTDATIIVIYLVVSTNLIHRKHDTIHRILREINSQVLIHVYEAISCLSYFITPYKSDQDRIPRFSALSHFPWPNWVFSSYLSGFFFQ